MKRSKINAAIKWSEELLKKHNISLPDYGKLPADKNIFKDEKYDGLVKTMLGWDITDYGSNDFEHVGTVLFTVRNGYYADLKVGVPYCEKYIILKDGLEQEIPMHYHVNKTEDIINRAGGIFCCQVAMCGEDGQPDFNKDVLVYRDGIPYKAKGGEIIEITNGNSITLTPYIYHRFYAKTGYGDLIVGEVSKINDDNTDNYFAVDRPRFAKIEEDEPAYRLLCNEYRK